jgi:hypothetical protein
VCWRVQVHCNAVARGLPTVLALVTVGGHLLLGASTLIEFGGLSALD